MNHHFKQFLFTIIFYPIFLWSAGAADGPYTQIYAAPPVFSSAADFLKFYTPLRADEFVKAGHDETMEQEIAISLFSSLDQHASEFFSLSPTPDQLIALLEIPRLFCRGQLHELPSGEIVLNTIDHVLEKVGSHPLVFTDWLKVMGYQAQSAAEFESQKKWALAKNLPHALKQPLTLSDLHSFLKQVVTDRRSIQNLGSGIIVVTNEFLGSPHDLKTIPGPRQSAGSITPDSYLNSFGKIMNQKDLAAPQMELESVLKILAVPLSRYAQTYYLPKFDANYFTLETFSRKSEVMEYVSDQYEIYRSAALGLLLGILEKKSRESLVIAFENISVLERAFKSSGYQPRFSFAYKTQSTAYFDFYVAKIEPTEELSHSQIWVNRLILRCAALFSSSS